MADILADPIIRTPVVVFVLCPLHSTETLLPLVASPQQLDGLYIPMRKTFLSQETPAECVVEDLHTIQSERVVRLTLNCI